MLLICDQEASSDGALAPLTDGPAADGAATASHSSAVGPSSVAVVQVDADAASKGAVVAAAPPEPPVPRVRSGWVLGTVYDRSGFFYPSAVSADDRGRYSVRIVEPRRLASSLEVMATMYEGKGGNVAVRSH